MFKRGISAKELRPFSVEDPDGQGRRRSGTTVPVSTRLASPGNQSAPLRTGEPARAGAPGARLAYFVVVTLWGIGLLASAGVWLPELLGALRPHIERVIAKWELELERSSGSAPAAEDTPRVSPATLQERGPVPCAPGDPLCSADPAGPNPDPPDPAGFSPATPAHAELLRVCERAVQCCLTVQGEQARSLCENFRKMQVVGPCLQGYDAFAEVGSQRGRSCQQ